MFSLYKALAYLQIYGLMLNLIYNRYSTILVGIGNSAVDIAVDLSNTASEVKYLK